MAYDILHMITRTARQYDSYLFCLCVCVFYGFYCSVKHFNKQVKRVIKIILTWKKHLFCFKSDNSVETYLIKLLANINTLTMNKAAAT